MSNFRNAPIPELISKRNKLEEIINENIKIMNSGIDDFAKQVIQDENNRHRISLTNIIDELERR